MRDVADRDPIPRPTLPQFWFLHTDLQFLRWIARSLCLHWIATTTRRRRGPSPTRRSSGLFGIASLFSSSTSPTSRWAEHSARILSMFVSFLVAHEEPTDCERLNVALPLTFDALAA